MYDANDSRVANINEKLDKSQKTMFFQNIFFNTPSVSKTNIFQYI